MSYQQVLVYDTAGTFLGSGIKDQGAIKLQTTNLYVEGEEDKLAKRLNELNEHQDLSAYWPDAKDPQVQAVLANPDFMPIEYSMQEVVDDDHSHYIYEQVPEVDEMGNNTGRLTDGANIDRLASTIRTKMMNVPVRPSDELYRTKAACEIVARKRAGL